MKHGLAPSPKTTKYYWGDFLKELRTRTGMTQPELARLSGLTRDDIANYERGRAHISVGAAVKIYEALASKDTSGEALTAAVICAEYNAELERWNLKKYEYELKHGARKLEAMKGWVREAEATEKRLKNLKQSK